MPSWPVRPRLTARELVSYLVGALSPVNHKGFYQCWGRLSQKIHSLMDKKGRNKDQKSRVRKRRVVGRIYGMKYSWKGHKDRNRHKNRIKKESDVKHRYNIYNRLERNEASAVGLCQKHKPQHLHHVKVSPPGRVPVEYLFVCCFWTGSFRRTFVLIWIVLLESVHP